MRFRILVVTLVTAALLSGASYGTPQKQTKKPQGLTQTGRNNGENYFTPHKLMNLGNIQTLLQRKSLTPEQKTEVLFHWLEEERKQPSPTRTGLGGGDINSSYIQAQIVVAIADVGNPLVLRRTAKDQKNDLNHRDAASLALGLMGDTTQEPSLIRILKTKKEPYFRATAAEALGGLGTASALPAIKLALADKYTVMGGVTCVGPAKKPGIIYPVREAAKTAIRQISRHGAEGKRYRNRIAARFNQRLAEARKRHGKTK